MVPHRSEASLPLARFAEAPRHPSAGRANRMAASVCGAVLLVVSAGCTSTPRGSVGTSEPIAPSPAAAASSAAPLSDGSVDVTEANRRVELIMGASGRYEDMIHAMLVMVDGKLVVEQYGKYGK